MMQRGQQQPQNNNKPLPPFHRVDSNEVAQKRLLRKRCRRDSGANTQAVEAAATAAAMAMGGATPTRTRTQTSAQANNGCGNTINNAGSRVRLIRSQDSFKKQRGCVPRVIFRDELCDMIPPPLVEYNDIDPTDIWYTKSDYQEFKETVKKDVLHMAMMCHRDSLEDLDFTEHSVVGIEKYCCSQQEQNNMKLTREQLIRAVLDQQATQKMLNMKDQDTISMICQVYTQSAIQSAQQRARAFNL